MDTYEYLHLVLGTPAHDMREFSRAIQHHRALGFDPFAKTIGFSQEMAYRAQHFLGSDPKEKLKSLATELDRIACRLIGNSDCSTDRDVSSFTRFARPFLAGRFGLFLTDAAAHRLLTLEPPRKTLALFAGSLPRAIAAVGLDGLLIAARFVDGTPWLVALTSHYHRLQKKDFIERPIRVVTLPADPFFGPARAFIDQKEHNVTHLKEFGVIGMVPYAPGEGTVGLSLKTAALFLHYIHEILFYNTVIRRLAERSGLSDRLAELLSLALPRPQIHRVWYIVQKYLEKGRPNPPFAFQPHVNPEVLHWAKATDELLHWLLPGRAASSFFSDSHALVLVHDHEVISCNLMDVVLAMVQKLPDPFYYHAREALWMRLAADVYGSGVVRERITDHLLHGFFHLS